MRRFKTIRRSLLDRSRSGVSGATLLVVVFAASLWTSLVGCSKGPSNAPPPKPVTVSANTETPANVDIPLGLPLFEVPPDNLMTAEKIELGKKLFFDTNLSSDRSMSCATCHDEQTGWSNGQAFAVGIDGTVGTRNTPTLFNVAYNRFQFWDGRAATLEKQALGPILNPAEMMLTSHEEIVARVSEKPEYHELFSKAFDDGITPTNVAKAIASFERTILAGDAPYDRFQNGDLDSLSPSAQRGMKLFFGGRARCGACHPAPFFTDSLFYNLGVGMDKDNPDLGRRNVTNMESSTGKFKTPTLRNIAMTAPYMHDGSMKTLDEVMEFYIKGGHKNPYLDGDVVKIRMNAEEKQELITFMVEGLTSSDPLDRPTAMNP